MLKMIRSYFSKSDKDDFHKKNKLRFESIHSDKRSDQLQNIYRRLIDQDLTLTNNEILQHYSDFSTKIQTNTYAAAELELVSISTLCYFRPELTNTLIRASLLCIVSSWGDKINFDDIIEFVYVRIFSNRAEPYGGWPQDEGIKWLNEILPKTRRIVEEVLVDVVNKNQEEMDTM